MPDYLATGSTRYLPDDLPSLDELNLALAQENERPEPTGANIQATPQQGGMASLALLSQIGALGGNNKGGTRRKKDNGSKNNHGKTHSIGVKGLPDSIHNSVNENRRIAKAIIARKYPKWNHKDYRALVALWNRESGWRATADNETSSAYGIPQALTELHHLGKSYKNSPINQIQWGLKYIAGKYGSPSAANRYSIQHHSY